MNDTNDTNPLSSAPNDADKRIASLENQVTILLLALVVMAAPLAYYFYRQAADAGKEYESVSRVLTTYNQNQANIQKMVSQLAVFGQTHRDIQPVLEHFGVPVAGATAAPAPGRR